MEGARASWVWTGLLVLAGVGSSLLTGSVWPLALALGAGAVGWTIAGPRALAPASRCDARQEFMAELEGPTRRRYLELERTAGEIRTLLARSERDSNLWRPEVERVDALVQGFLRIATRLEDDDALAADVDELALELDDLKLRSPEPHVAQQIARVEERMRLLEARRSRNAERRAQLAEIEHGLETVRDRIAALKDDADLRPRLSTLLGGVEAAAAAEDETRRWAAGGRERLAEGDRGEP